MKIPLSHSKKCKGLEQPMWRWSPSREKTIKARNSRHSCNPDRNADMTSHYENSVVAFKKMQRLGATNVALVTIPGENHQSAQLPAFVQSRSECRYDVSL